ncbi:MAG: radical SAM protein [Desulfobacteraceae bacterium]|jgi:radical SAM superfamily enzyme YgiQ (UPF0313 family)
MIKKTGTTPWDSETGAIRKSWVGRTSIALVYPNTYGVGMANLGFQSVYRLLNDDEGIVCERAFLPARESREKQDKPQKLVSIESGRPLKDFQVIAFSVSFENDFLNILDIIHLAGLPLRSNARGDSHPLLIAGGVACLLNPEPLASFIDCFLVGEAEALLLPFIHLIRENMDRHTLLKRLAANVPGAYVPRFYDARYHPDGTLAAFEPNRANVPQKVKRIYPADISDIPTSTAVLSSASAFDSAYLTEVSRGCTHGCRFCSAGFIYRPPRYRSKECLIAECLKASAVTDRVGLVGTAISDHPDITDVCRHPELSHLRFAYSSLRADAVTADHLAVLAASGTKTATIAPEAGSERMRTVINKGITEAQILSAAESLVKAGIMNLKLYFMIGLPGELPEDITETIALCKKIRSVFLETSREKGRMGQITVGVSSFVPKASTPFQWAAMDTADSLKKKIKTLKSGINPIPNITVTADSPRGAIIQALLSRGDRTVSDLLEAAHANQGNWASTLKSAAHAPGLFIHRERSEDELFPWDFIDIGIHKSFLRSEYQRAIEIKPSAPCPVVGCNRCGVCGG